MKLRRARRLALLGLALATACATPPPRVPLVPLQTDDVTAAAWVTELRGRGAHRAVRAVGKLWVEAEGGKGRVREVILAQRPARLRLETLNLLGQTQALLVIDGEAFGFYDGRTLQQGVRAEQALESLGLRLPPAAAVSALLAAPALPEGAPLEVFDAGGARIVRFPSWRLGFSPLGELSTLDALDAMGRPTWSVRYDRWQEVPGGRYPFEIGLHFAGSELRAELELERVELDPALDEALFRVPGS